MLIFFYQNLQSLTLTKVLNSEYRVIMDKESRLACVKATCSEVQQHIQISEVKCDQHKTKELFGSLPAYSEGHQSREMLLIKHGGQLCQLNQERTPLSLLL
jgi:hypothetical protein